MATGFSGDLCDPGIFLGISMVLTNNKIAGCLGPKLFTNIGLGRIGPFTFPILMILIALISYFVPNKTVHRTPHLRSRR